MSLSMVKNIGYTELAVTPNAVLCFIIRTPQFRFADGRLPIVFVAEFLTMSVFSGQKNRNVSEARSSSDFRWNDVRGETTLAGPTQRASLIFWTVSTSSFMTMVIFRRLNLLELDCLSCSGFIARFSLFLPDKC
jgi:hypothetical protein